MTDEEKSLIAKFLSRSDMRKIPEAFRLWQKLKLTECDIHNHTCPKCRKET